MGLNDFSDIHRFRIGVPAAAIPAAGQLGLTTAELYGYCALCIIIDFCLKCRRLVY
jgi:hypothetical protein